MALPARRHRRRQQPDDTDHRRRRDVRDRFPRERVRGQRRRRTSSVDLRRQQSHRRRSAGRLRVPQPRRHLCGRRHLRRRGLVPVRARRQDREADSELRQGRSGQRDPGCAEDALPGGEDGDQSRLLVHDRASGVQGRPLHRQHAKREPYSRRSCAGGRCEDRQGHLALQHGAAGRTGSRLGHRRPDLGRRRTQRRRNLGNAVDRSRIGTGLRGGRQSIRRQHQESRDQPLHRLDPRALA